MMRWRSLFVLSLALTLRAAAGDSQTTTFVFGIGSSDLDAEMRGELDELASRLKRSGEHVVIDGHSDSAGGEELNDAVARERADRVAAALQWRGVPASQIEVRSFSMHQPVASNATADGRALNRRVVIQLGTDGVAQREAPVRQSAPKSSAETKTAETKTAETKTAETKTAETKPAETKPAETKPAETKTAETKTAETKTAETKTAETKTAETKTAETKPAETKPADAPVAEVAETPLQKADAPVKSAPAEATAVSTTPEAVATTSPSTQRPPLWVPITTTVVAAAATGVAIGFLADTGTVKAAIAKDDAQLVRGDLYGDTRTSLEAHRAQLNQAATNDYVTAGVAGAVAVGAAVASIILWVQETRDANTKTLQPIPESP